MYVRILCLCIGLSLLLGVSSSSTLRQLAQRKGILIGSCASPTHFSDANYTAVLGAQFSVITPENEMKWGATEPSRNTFTYAQGDAVLDYALKHSQKVRGHNLAWGQDNPGWLVNGNFNATTKQEILKNHIVNVMGHYKGKLLCWDVVNEALSDSSNGNSMTFKQNVWYPAIPNYVDLAFQWAAQVDSSVKLFYNDYGADASGEPKSDAIYNMVKGMKARGIPIHGVGFQFHVSLGYCPPNSQIVANFKRFSDLGLEIHITELDVSLDGGSGSEAQLLAAQAACYKNVLQACLGNKMCTSFESWGFTDLYTWLGSNKQPLIYDTHYMPKPAYTAIATLLES